MGRPSSTLLAKTAATIMMLMAIVTIAAVALHGLQMHLTSRDSQQRALHSLATLGAARLSDAVETRDANASVVRTLTAQFDRWAPVALQQPDVVAVALRDADGVVLATVPEGIPIGILLASLPPRRGTSGTFHADLRGQGQEALRVVSRPLGDVINPGPLGTLVVVAGHASRVAAWAVWSLAFGVPLGGIAAIGFIIGLRWLRHRVYDPLGTLARKEGEDIAAWLKRLPTERRDELGRIARGAGQLAAELHDLHAQVEHLKSTMDSRVAEQTREINTQLRDTQRKIWQDPLTKLGNRRLLDDRLEKIFEAQRQSGGDLVLVMFDIDHFKTHNDTMGHAAGDELLCFFGQLLRGSLRESDVAIRYAGDEFVVLLPDVKLDDAVSLANRIVRLFAQQSAMLETRPAPTLSAGVVSMRRSGALNGHSLLESADAALYHTKDRGKNGVSVAATARKGNGQTALTAPPG